MKMTMGPEIRYGKALFSLFKESGDKKIPKDVLALKNSFIGNNEIAEVLNDSAVSKEDKKGLLLALLKKIKACETVTNFTALMCDKGRANLYINAITWFDFYKTKEDGVITANVKSAKPLTSGQKKSIEKFVKDSAVNVKQVELEEEIDTSLIAGFTVRIGSIEHDISVRGRLDSLRTSLN